MRTLRLGQSGDDVKLWQVFLVGLGYEVGEADGSFGPKTEAATKEFQSSLLGVAVDGVAGRGTLAEAIAAGFGEVHDEGGTDEETSSAWPPAPNFPPLTGAERGRLFTNFSYKPSPVPGNPEAITITDGWAAKNIVMVELPIGKVPFHAKAADQLKALWTAWEEAGLLPLVNGWAGSWVPRFVRGSRVYLSNHAWGTAFDINVPWNALGAQPALVGQKGSVRKLVPLAHEHGFFWGGHFPGRPDGMHFEVAFLK